MIRHVVSLIGPVLFFCSTLIAPSLLQSPDISVDIFGESKIAPTADSELVRVGSTAAEELIPKRVDLDDFYPPAFDHSSDEESLAEVIAFTEKTLALREKVAVESHTAGELVSIFSDIELPRPVWDATTNSEDIAGASEINQREDANSAFMLPQTDPTRSIASGDVPSLLSLDGSSSVRALTSAAKSRRQSRYPFPMSLGSGSSANSRSVTQGSGPSAGSGAGGSATGATSGGSGPGSAGLGGSGSTASTSAIDEFLARQQLSPARSSGFGSQPATPPATSLVSTSSRPQLKPDGKFGIPNAQYWTFDFQDNDGDNDVDVDDARNHFRAYTSSLEPLLQSAKQVVKYSPSELNAIFDDLNSQIPTTPTPRSPSYLTFMIIEFPIKGFYLPRDEIPDNPGLPPGGLD